MTLYIIIISVLDWWFLGQCTVCAVWLCYHLHIAQLSWNNLSWFESGENGIPRSAFGMIDPVIYRAWCSIRVYCLAVITQMSAAVHINKVAGWSRFETHTVINTFYMPVWHILLICSIQLSNTYMPGIFYWLFSHTKYCSDKQSANCSFDIT